MYKINHRFEVNTKPLKNIDKKDEGSKIKTLHRLKIQKQRERASLPQKWAIAFGYGISCREHVTFQWDDGCVH